jgi:two-component system, OmpR family, sensor kinase
MSLRLRLVLILAPLFVLGLIVADVTTYTSLQSSLINRLDDSIFAAHDDTENALIGALVHGGARAPGPGGFSSLPRTTWAEVTSPSGTVNGHPFAFDQTDAAATPVLPANLKPGTPDHRNFMTVPGTGGVSNYRIFVDTSQDVSNGTLVVAVPLDDTNKTLRDLLLLEAGGGGAVTVVLVLLTWLVVRRGLRPLERMGDTARSIVATDLSRRITPSNETTEVGRLGLALNTMLAQLEAAFAERARNEQRLRHFISDASHELRTPLTSMQGYAELLRREPDMDGEDMRLAMRRMEDETRRMGVLVDDLLLLARLDQGRPLERSRVDLEALVADACADARAADPSRTITARVSAPLVVTGDDMRLRQVLGNVVRNALVHTAPGTPVEIDLRPDGGRAVIEVVDHGGGIPAGHGERIFERFHRADPGRSGDQGGSGLGLSIAAAVVAAHGGGIGVHDTPGGGATFRIELPLPDAAASAPQADPATAPAPAPAAAELTGDSKQNPGTI